MARTVREASLATRSARLRLAVASKPYWRVIEQGLHLGYRRRATGGSWIARRRNDERHLSRDQARSCRRPAGRQRREHPRLLAGASARRASGAARSSGSPPAMARCRTVPTPSPVRWPTISRTTGAAAASRSRASKASSAATSCRTLGKLPVAKLTPQRLRDWHRGLAERARYWRSRKGARQTSPLRPQGCRGRAPPARQRQPRAHLSQSGAQSRLAQRPGAERRCLAAGQAVPLGGSPPRPLSQPTTR